MLKLSRLFLLIYTLTWGSLLKAADIDYSIADDDYSISNVASGDLLVGRRSFAIIANSTCSFDQYNCSDHKDPPLDHAMCAVCKDGIKNVVKNDLSVSETEEESPNEPEMDQRWWMSLRGDEVVEIKITLEALFTMERLRIKFKSPSPDALFIERSKDFAQSWSPIAYYSLNCSAFFPEVPSVDSVAKERIKSDLDYLENEPFCVNKYDSTALSLNNSTYLIFYDDYELIYRPSSLLVDEDLLILAKRFNLKPSLAENRNYDIKLMLRRALTITNIRVTFLKFPTTSIKSSPTSELTSQIERPKSVTVEVDANNQLFDYYSINEINLNGNCFCNGHGIRCRPLDSVHYDFEPNRLENLRENDKTTRAKKKKIINGKCECDHNTDGTNCEKCLSLYNDRQWMPALSKYETNACKKCDCNNHSNSCHFDENVFRRRNLQYEVQGEFLSNENLGGGVCHDCLSNTDGLNCEKCRVGFYRDHDYPITHPETCKKCTCNLMGTKNLEVVNGKPICTTRHCECKKNVQGTNCNTCKNGYWNLSFELEHGCQKCNCNPIGTMDNLGCDKLNGECYPCKRFVYGPGCTRCQTGYYGLSESKFGCKPCGCSMHGSRKHWQCHEVTGQCDCKPKMKGRRCDQIDNGYVCPYGMASATSAETLPEVCKNCACPNINGKNYAYSCYYYGESSNQQQYEASSINNLTYHDGHFFTCNCLIGFTGPRCLECESGYYGYPIAGVPCRKCDCNNNINRNDPMSCDKLTGVCLKCHYNTVGLNCERCKPGFYGDAKKQKCSPCKCDPNGTRECDSSTGKCICLPDTTGALCDQCRSSTWRSPNGCVDCQCNTEGTLENSDACDQSNGQCPCREGRVGPKCDQVISETVPQAENTTQTVSRIVSAGTSFKIKLAKPFSTLNLLLSFLFLIFLLN